jgi:hypothetical protein
MWAREDRRQYDLHVSPLQTPELRTATYLRRRKAIDGIQNVQPQRFCNAVPFVNRESMIRIASVR